MPVIMLSSRCQLLQQSDIDWYKFGAAWGYFLDEDKFFQGAVVGQITRLLMFLLRCGGCTGYPIAPDLARHAEPLGGS